MCKKLPRAAYSSTTGAHDETTDLSRRTRHPSHLSRHVRVPQDRYTPSDSDLPSHGISDGDDRTSRDVSHGRDAAEHHAASLDPLHAAHGPVLLEHLRHDRAALQALHRPSGLCLRGLLHARDLPWSHGGDARRGSRSCARACTDAWAVRPFPAKSARLRGRLPVSAWAGSSHERARGWQGLRG